MLGSATAPGPALLGIAAGLMGWEGSAGLLGALRQGISFSWGLGGALAGAAGLWALWRSQLRALQHAAPDKKADHEHGVTRAMFI